MRRTGWFNESYRHTLAAKGIKTSLYARTPQLRTIKGMWDSPQMREAVMAERRVGQAEAAKPYNIMTGRGMRNMQTGLAGYMQEHPELLAQSRMHRHASYGDVMSMPEVQEALEAEKLEGQRKYMRDYMRAYNEPAPKPRSENVVVSMVPEIQEQLLGELTEKVPGPVIDISPKEVHIEMEPEYSVHGRLGIPGVKEGLLGEVIEEKREYDRQWHEAKAMEEAAEEKERVLNIMAGAGVATEDMPRLAAKRPESSEHYRTEYAPDKKVDNMGLTKAQHGFGNWLAGTVQTFVKVKD